MLSVAKGTCHCVFVYDIAFSIDLNEAERRLSSATREGIKHKRRAPPNFEYRPAPLRINQGAASVRLDDHFQTEPQVDLIAYDFGAISVIYRIPIQGNASALLSLSEVLYENRSLLADSRQRVEGLWKLIEAAVSKPQISSFVEDYVIFLIEAFSGPVGIEDLVKRDGPLIAQILRAEERELSADEVQDALSHRISFGRDDVVIVDWNAALVVDKEPEDVLTVLEFANVELLEMRFLDQRLDDALGEAYNRMSKRTQRWFQFPSKPSDLRAISQWQVDSAVLFEGVNNVLKLIGDQYLARLYRLAAERLHLSEWDASILRKLQTLESIYQKISDQVVSRRTEVLEWIVIVLILIEILLPLLSVRAH